MSAPMPNDAAQIAAKLSDVERAIIPFMSDGEHVYTVANTATASGIPIKEARKAFASLRKAGLATYGALWNEDEGCPAGSGTWLTDLGLAVCAHLESKS